LAEHPDQPDASDHADHEETTASAGVVGKTGTGAGADGLLNVTVTAEDVLEFPAASRATAVMVYMPFAESSEEALNVYGAEVISGPAFEPFIWNWTPATPTLSEAAAVNVTTPERIALFAGEVTETVGGCVSAWTCAVTAMVVDCEALPPAPEQFNVYAVFAVGETDWLPDAALVPDQPPLAVQLAAFVDDQLRVAELPDVIDAGAAEMATAGAGAAGTDAVPPAFTL
jgi:hypothetical protein